MTTPPSNSRCRSIVRSRIPSMRHSTRCETDSDLPPSSGPCSSAATRARRCPCSPTELCCRVSPERPHASSSGIPRADRLSPRPVVRYFGPRVMLLGLTQAFELFVPEVLDPDQLISGFPRDVEELVELHVDGGRIPVQGVLDQEDHEEGEHGRAGVDDNCQ